MLFLECFLDLSEIFGGLTGGIILTLICVFCYGYFRLTEEQRQRLGRVAAVLVHIMEFLVRLWHAVRRRRGDQGIAIIHVLKLKMSKNYFGY